jgi:hypothetical protein
VLILKGKVVDYMNKVTYIKLNDHDMELLLPMKMDVGQRVEITITPIQTRAAGVSLPSQLSLPFPEV